MKRIILTVTVIMALLLAGTTAFAATTLRVAVGDPENSEQGVAAKAFKQYVEEQSKGDIEVLLFFSGALGDETETIHNVRAGTLPISVVGIANIVPFAKETGVLTLPYLFDNLDEVVAATNGAPAELLNSYTKKAGFRVLCWTYTDFRYISNSKRPITKMADMQGMKFRVPQSAVLIAAYKAFGGSPVPISWAETFTSLQQGVVDGQCYGYIGFQAMKFNEANQRFISEVHYTYQLQPMIMSERVLRTMSAEQQKLMMDAGKYAQDEVLKYQISEAGKAKEQLMKEGIQISQLTDEAEWKKVALEKVWPEMASFVGGKQAINAFLSAAGKQPWNP